MNRSFICIGHRGTRILDENTKCAFNKALKYGADYIEFDVRKTKDDKLVIIHDASLDRTTKGTGLIKNLTYDEISKYKTKMNNETIPLLSDVLESFKGKIKFIIELKEANLRNHTMRIINDMDLIKDCIFSGRILSEINLIKKSYPETKTCFNITKGIGLTLPELLKLGYKKKKINYNFDIISLRSGLINSRFINICQKNSISILSWDFIGYSNPLEKIKELIKMGLDGILFDNYKNIPIIKQWLKKI
ncbi:MAG: glycerophosphodiester phosphodiesterase [Promethearchaeota archaeon]